MTIKASDFSIATIQVVAFTPDRSALSPPKVLSTVISRFSDRAGGDVQVLPIPDEAPDEIPRLELKSEDLRWSFTWAPGRSTATWSRVEESDLAPSAIECAEMLVYLFQTHSVAVNRLACVIGRGAEIVSPAPALVAQFCATSLCSTSNHNAPLRNSRAFQIHNLKQYESRIPGVLLNSWVRCKAENGIDPDGPGKMIFEQDLNTPFGEMSRRFTPQQISDFYAMINDEANQIVSLYFPE